jgi:hypothetical protein
VLDEVPRAVPATLGILASLRPDLVPLRQAFTSLVGPVTQLSLHGCDLQSMATGLRSITNWGALPGGNLGPNVGFQLTLIASPASVNSYAAGPRWSEEQAYPPPCALSPGATLPESSLLSVLSGAVR